METGQKSGRSGVVRMTSSSKNKNGHHPVTGVKKGPSDPIGEKTAGAIRSALHFQGSWRSYQKRVLDNANAYLKDGRIHVAAAPGSGKTTLGIELIARADRPCLILAPSITIREQWLMRIREGFGAPETLLSNDIRRPALITAITYQALHSCLRKTENVEEDEEGRREETDYTGVDLDGMLERMNVGTFCLDEAHHLRNEWQKALEEVTARHRGILISLTATPPYDAAPAQWERYLCLCGPIDEEIGVPELVKEKSLCPHQDYVYFNMPTPEEEQTLKKLREASDKQYRELMQSEAFARAIASHSILRRTEEDNAAFLQDRTYLLAFLSFLREKGNRMPAPFAKLTGDAGIPPMTPGLLSVLLQGFLFQDSDSYECDKAFRESLANRLRARGLIHKNQVELASCEEEDRMLINSRGKLLSIARIAAAEQAALGEELRLLILTDFIRSEYLSAIGEESHPIDKLGVVPIFEYVRRSLDRSDLKIAALSGSVVILSASARDAFLTMAEENGQQASFKECQAAGYAQVNLSGGGPRPTAYLTKLFARGLIHILVGTKSLLGEGWDAPCVNTLILASFVGSYMLSNQMRGRAIRVWEEEPDKVGNIWHLICMEPQWGKENGVSREKNTADFLTLRRRFEGFLGVNYEQDRIENGLDRLTYIRPPYDNRSLEEINRKMLALSADRAGLQERWKKALEAVSDPETVESVGISENELKAEGQRKRYRRKKYLGMLVMALSAAAGILLWACGSVLAVAAAAAALAGLFGMRCAGKKEAVFSHPEAFLQAVGCAMQDALRRLDELSFDDSGVETGRSSGTPGYCFLSLRGGTQREKSVFADTAAAFFGDLDAPRYLLMRSNPGRGDRGCYPVPERFGRKKEDALLFASCLSDWIGPCEPIYTKSETGRRALLLAGLQDEAQRQAGVERVVRHKQVQNRGKSASEWSKE